MNHHIKLSKDANKRSLRLRYLTWFIYTTLCVLLAGNPAWAQPVKNKPLAHPEEKLGWQLGAQAYTFKKFTFTEAVAKIASCDLPYVEAYPQQEIGGGIAEKMDHHMSASSRKYVKRLLKANKVHWQAYGVIKAKDTAEWRKVFEFAKSMGIATITCEPDVALLDEISKLCDEFDIQAAIHNHASPSFYWHPDTVLQAIQGKSNRLGVAADIGHWLRSGLDPVASLKVLNGRVFHVHFKDLNKKSDKAAHDVHWGTGVIDIPAVLEELKRQQFTGMIAAEYEYNWDNNVADVKISVENFRKILLGLPEE